MTAVSLLAVLEVDIEDCVRCQAPDCNHTVYKRIHVVRTEGVLKVLGSSCFEKLFHGQAVVRQKPAFTHPSGKVLTAEDRVLLQQNTELLIAQLEAQFAAEQRVSADTRPPPEPARRPTRRRPFWATNEAPLDPLIEAQAKQRVRQKHGVDPEQPGWRGLVLAEVRAIIAENAA